eukprot:jgi/Ulvmu1/4125/UM019_0104.1
MEAPVQALRSIFPEESVDALQNALNLTGHQPERAAEYLLERAPAGDAGVAPGQGRESPLPNNQQKRKPKPYSRIQSGVRQCFSASPRRRGSPAAQSPQQSRGASPAASFASVVSRNAGNLPDSHRSTEPAPVAPQHALQLARSHPWAGGAVVQSVLQASEGNVAVASAWLADMAPFIHGELEAARIVMYADEVAAPPASPGGMPPAAGQPDAPEGLYWEHRADAMKLTREWRRLFRQSVAAAKAGDLSTGRFLMAQAHAARAQALEAHDSAAVGIEAAMNAGRGRGLWELDLHGLHSHEAVAALQRRLQLVASLPPQQRRGARLRVITGRGVHSSAGEATLPRAVSGYLERHARQYGASVTPALGAFLVALPGR